ncbi:MAG: circularly permuted type 2 ATP-grasp protein [Aestuariivita sp.]|nr:circularly permuted type 2 ATP-grasp protein [Aestuariivita sp.]MCY4347083.1 circularly permuted type 2 ATP-grasp protein [Aestuariivita sp.]
MTGPINFDEMWGSDGIPRDPYHDFLNWFEQEDPKRLQQKQKESEELFRLTGITFNVYGREEAEERLIPFDIIPRIVSASEWRKVVRGIEQRVRAINAFLHDLYHRQEILRAKRIPESIISNNSAFLPQMIGISPPGNIYTQIVGVDLVRTGHEEFYVLEDNARTPSGVSYMLENRETMLQMFPELFSQIRVQPVQTYPTDLLRSLSDCAPSGLLHEPTVAVLTPGIYNSAYFEHSFLADKMGVELVEMQDLRIIDGRVAMRTIAGYKTIDVLYRRIDDDFLDPLNFRSDSQIGVAGLFDVYRAGRITIANAPGTGIADDKAIYSYIPEIIRFYTGERPLLKNVPTWRCVEKEALAYVLDHLSELVVKEVHGSGGYGMLIGPAATKKELATFAKKLKSRPANFIAQPTLALSTVPILTRTGLSSRHVDLRPFVLVSPKGITVTPGGLTRVALKKKSLVVNSSQGGGTKDTWVLEN